MNTPYDNPPATAWQLKQMEEAGITVGGKIHFTKLETSGTHASPDQGPGGSGVSPLCPVCGEETILIAGKVECPDCGFEVIQEDD